MADTLYAGVHEVRRKIAEVPTTGAIGLAEVSVTWNFCPRRATNQVAFEDDAEREAIA